MSTQISQSTDREILLLHQTKSAKSLWYHSQTNQGMLTIVKNALNKLYQGEKEPNTLLQYQGNILDYFQQNNIDGDSFHNKQNNAFVNELMQYVLGDTAPNSKMKQAFALLYKYIHFFYNDVPLKSRRSENIPKRRSVTFNIPKRRFLKKVRSLPRTTLQEEVQNTLTPLKLLPETDEEIQNIRTTKLTNRQDDEKSETHSRSISKTHRKSVVFGHDSVYQSPALFLMRQRIHRDIIFKWTQTSVIALCDHLQLLYIVCVVIDAMNHEIQKNKDDAQLLYNKTLVLGYLHFCKRIHGMSFQQSHDRFVQNVKEIVFDTRNANDFLTERLKQQYAHHLYQNMSSFNVSSISESYKCVISFHPLMSWFTEEEESLAKSSLNIMYTLNQYKHSSYLTKPTENRKVMDVLQQCNDKISAILCNKWTTHIKNREKIWDHNIQSIKDCSVLNMLYVLDCVLKHTLGKKRAKRFRHLEKYAPKLTQFFEEYGVDGSVFTYFTSHQQDFVKQLDSAIDPKLDLSEHLTDLCKFIHKMNVFRITIFHIQSDVDWNTNIESIKQCKEKDILFILIHSLADPSLASLHVFQEQIVEYFVGEKITGIMLHNMKLQIFVDQLDKFIKCKNKKLLTNLYYAIKRCQVQDMTNISMEQNKNTANVKKGGFTKWNQRTHFKNIKRVGYQWDDGVIVVADIIPERKEQNRNKFRDESLSKQKFKHENKIKLQLSTRRIGAEQNTHLTEPFWLTLPNAKLCKPTKEVIEKSHHDIFNKWMMILRIKNRQNSGFEDNVFRNMANVSQIHPQLLFTIRHSNYVAKLEDKTYDNVLQSLLACSLAIKCRRSRCHGSPKLNCYCDMNRFQMYTYCMIIVILTEKSDAVQGNDTMLNIIKTERDNAYGVCEKICEFLPAKYREKGSYFDRYKKHIRQWLLHDFYNIMCSHCGSINKSIMMNRVFHYSNTLRNCRVCGVIVSSTKSEQRAVRLQKAASPKTKSGNKTKAKSIEWFCHKAHKHALREEGIKAKELEKALNECSFNDRISKHEESELLNILRSLLNEGFDELTYYLSRFLDDIHGWKALRIKITADHYFIGMQRSFIPANKFMKDAGIHPSHVSIFKDCWNRGLFQSVKDNRPLIDVLNNNINDEQKTNRKKDVLCIDFECLQTFRKLTPSIAAFAAQFIQKLKECSSDHKMDLFSFIKRFVDFKVDRNVLPVITQVDLLSLLWNKWQYLSPVLSSNASYTVIASKHDSLRSELLEELHDVSGISNRYSNLYNKAENIWKKSRQIKARRSEWNEITGIKPGTRISVKKIHALLLFVEIAELRVKIRSLLAETSVVSLYQRFGNLFKLLKETIYLYGDVLETNQTVYYRVDTRILLDNYRAMIHVPIIGSISQQNQNHKQFAECSSSGRLYCFNLNPIMASTRGNTKQSRYLFFGGSSSSLSQMNTNDSNWRMDPDILEVFTDEGDEWLRVEHRKEFKKIKRNNDDLLVILYDKWYDILLHFDCELRPQRDPLSEPFMQFVCNILTQYDITCDQELMFRIKTVLTYYKTSHHIIPNFAKFIKETNINVADHHIHEFHKIYDKEREIAQKRKLNLSYSNLSNQVLFRAVSAESLSSIMKSDSKQIESKTNTLAVYDVGIFMRYDVNNPRFDSLAEETMLNEVTNISNKRFNQHLIKAKEIHSRNSLLMLSTSDDFNFGIERYQPISISHIIAIIIHREETKYARAFNRSCLLLRNNESEIVIQSHCKNFYWFGRYLFECIEYFGELLNEQSISRQRQGLSRQFKFDLFAPLINFPRATTTSLDTAYHRAGDKGCVLELIPKYYGVLNSTKFINLASISEDYDPDTRLFFGRRCAIQIHNIWLSNHQSLQQYILPLLYLEKILLQTIFDRQFFNAKHLYDKNGEKSNIQKTLFNLIVSYSAIVLLRQENECKVDKETKRLVIMRYFLDGQLQEHEHNQDISSKVREDMLSKQNEEIQYALDLLENWCLQRTFITFESFAAELPFMIPSLKNYFVSRKDKHAPYNIHIDNLQIIMPNLKNYRDFSKHVVPIDVVAEEKKEQQKIYSTLIETIDHNLGYYYRAQGDRPYDAKFKTWCNENNYQDLDVKKELQSFRNCDPDKLILQFDKDCFGLHDLTDYDADEYRHVWEILCMASKPNLLKILYYALPKPCTEVDEKKHGFQSPVTPVTPLSQMVALPVFSHQRSISMGVANAYDKQEHDAIYRALSNCQRHEIADEICDILEKLGFWKAKMMITLRSYDSSKISNAQPKEDISEWKNRHKEELEKFYDPISKLHKASKKDFIQIAKKMVQKKTKKKLFSKHMVEMLSDRLMERLFTDIERMKQWKCNICWFINRKMMIGGLWCLYNQLNECGLCGEERFSINSKHSNNTRIHNKDKIYHDPTQNTVQLPDELKQEWFEINSTQKHGKCSMNSKIYLQKFTVKEMKQFITKSQKLRNHKKNIIHYFQQHRLNAEAFLNTNRKETIQQIVDMLKDQKLKGRVSKLYDALAQYIKKETIDCIPMRRIAVILRYYHSLTQELKTPYDRYSCSIRGFLSAFDSKDSRVQLLYDFDHVLKIHKPAIRAKQPYVSQCTKAKKCIHYIRIKKSKQTNLSQLEQQQLFHCDDWKDFEYILYLDKIHCIICHTIINHKKSKSVHVLNHHKEKHIIRRYSQFPVYSTGVYIDHSSLSPLHVNLKEELINNSVYTMTQRNWEDALEKAKDILSNKWKEDETKWRAKVMNEIYGIRIGDRIQIEHILVVYLYTSNSTLCSKFRESYRSSEYDNNNHNIRSYHINNFYWMGRFIYTAIQFFGEKPATKDVFYHGLKDQFLFTEFSVTIEPPTSTTKDREIARRTFALENGIVLTLKPKFKYQLNNSKYLDVSAISNYGKEEERLFAGMTVLAVVDIQYRCGTKLVALEKYALVFLYFERILEQTIHNKSYYNYGRLSSRDQRRYLWPLVQHQIQRNQIGSKHESDDEKKEDKDEYLYALFEHFCDSKLEYINLTCINDEIAKMDESIQSIFFKIPKKKRNVKWEINDANLRLIFPKLKGYKNYLGYWIHFDL